MPRFGYGEIEKALAQVFGMPEPVQTGMLRGRIIHLRKLGFGPRGKGRGTRTEYDYDAACKWMIALKLQDVGLDPMVVMDVVEGLWWQIGEIVQRANAPESEDDIFVAVYYPVLRAAWHHPTMPPSFTPFTSKEADKLMRWLTEYADRHAAVFNLSAHLRTLNQALGLKLP